MPTIYEALEKRLTEYSLNWRDIEAVTISESVNIKGTTNYSKEVKVINRDEAEEIFRKGRLLNEHGCTGPDNMPFYAYTKDRIFYMGCSDEMGGHWIDSIPRNPTDKEPARYLPS